MLCMRLGGSIAGTCEVGLTELTKNHSARLIAQIQGGILPCIRGGGNGREYPNLDAPWTRKPAIWR